MRHRLAALLVVWLGLLWAASPALACARAADRDCCPEGTTSPCPRERTDLSTLAALCCVSAPAASQAVAADTTRTTHVQPDHSGSPDPIITLAWFATLATPNYESPPKPPDTRFVGIDAARTYLHTLRLRL